MNSNFYQFHRKHMRSEKQKTLQNLFYRKRKENDFIANEITTIPERIMDTNKIRLLRINKTFLKM